MKNLFALTLVALLSTIIIPNKAFAQNSAALEIKEMHIRRINDRLYSRQRKFREKVGINGRRIKNDCIRNV